VSSRKEKHTRRSGSSAKRSDVGYGRPPREHQFKPGQSGNKRGRPKASASEPTVVHKLLNRKVEIRQNGLVRKISLLEAIYFKIAEDALKGNQKAAAFLLGRIQIVEPADQLAGRPILDSDDQKVLEFYAQRVADQLKKGEENE
jgi:Family of unknown function (DUF5681)